MLRRSTVRPVARALSSRLSKSEVSRAGISTLLKRNTTVLRSATIPALVASPKVLARGFASDMFCYQCEQTEGNKGCTTVGVCGKTPETAKMQDILLYSLIGLGTVCKRAREKGGIDTSKADIFILDAMFTTLTNVNFDAARFTDYIHRSCTLKKEMEAKLGSSSALEPEFAAFKKGEHPVNWNCKPNATTQDFLQMEGAFGVQHRLQAVGDTLGGLHEFLWYGLKGTAAYSHHAQCLGHTNSDVSSFLQDALCFLGSSASMDLNATLGMLMKCGEINVKVMAMLDGAHNQQFGTPAPSKVRTSHVAGKCIVVSGHDLADLVQLLEQTKGTGINVYTHGEMLPAHGYPGLNKYPHLVGNYGSAWQNQKFEFAQFPGAILMTSNCIVEPRKSYKDRIFTTSVVGFEGVSHIPGEPGKKDFTPVIQAALAAKGFTEADPRETSTTTGFGHHAILGMADTIISAVKEGKIKKFMVVGGCDGSESERSYFKDVVVNSSPQTVVLTLGCGKFRFNKLDTGVVPGLGIPRVLDMGQCNDAYGAVVVALKLAEVFKTDVNGLPLSLCLSWFEQKAAAVLLSLLSLGVKNITIGPELPAFLTKDALQVVIEKFGVRHANLQHPVEDVKLFKAD